MAFTGNTQIYGIDPYSTLTTAKHGLGQVGIDNLGRKFRFGQAGAALTAGKMTVIPAPVANHQNLTTAVAAAGSKTVTVTLGNTAATLDQYARGVLSVNAGTGAGTQCVIDTHPAANANGTLTITLLDSLPVALDGTSKCCLVANDYSGVVTSTTQTRKATGVSLVAFAQNAYGWFMTYGDGPVLADGAIAVGSQIILSGSVAGAVTVPSNTWSTALATTPVGQASLIAGVDTEYRPMFINID